MENLVMVIFLVLRLWIVLGNQLREQHARRHHQAWLKLRRRYRIIQEAIRMQEETLQRRRRRRQRIVMALLEQSSGPKRAAWALQRSSHWWDSVVPGFTEQQWLENFRMSEGTFTLLCNKLRPALERRDTSFRECLPLRKRVAIALWKLATGSEYRSIGHQFGVGITTVCVCVHDFCAAAETLLAPEQIHLPDEGKFRETASCFSSGWGLPQCVGAIHGFHIPVIAPRNCPTNYLSRKGGHSIILQAVVDGQGLFWDVFAGLPGSMDDASVLRCSTLWELASRGNLFPAHSIRIKDMDFGYYIMGNSAYPLQDWLLKPFSDTGRLTEQQLLFNQKFSLAHDVVNNALGRLKGRWRCLLKRNDCDISLVRSMVLTCCALHNLCEGHEEAYDNTWTTTGSNPGPVAAPPQNTGDERGEDKRVALMLHLSDR